MTLIWNKGLSMMTLLLHIVKVANKYGLLESDISAHRLVRGET